MNEIRQNIDQEGYSVYTHGIYDLANNSSLANTIPGVQYKHQIKHVPKGSF